MDDEIRDTPAPDEADIEQPAAEPAPEFAEGPLVEPAADAEPADGAEPSEARLDFGDTSQLMAIEESLETNEQAAPELAPDVMEAVLAEDTGVLPKAVLPPVEPAPAAPDGIDEAVGGIDLGPEPRSNVYVWVGLAAGVLIALAALGYFWWYSTSRPIVVPDVVGKLPAQATQAINDAGLRLGKVSEVPTDAAPAGTVIAQSPEALQERKPGASVSFTIAAPPETSKVPDVNSRSYDEAASTLVANRLTPRRIDSFSTTVAAGYVMGQLPAAGAAVVPGDPVALIVSMGQATTSFRVPQLTGLPEADAAVLAGALDVVSVSYRSVNNSIPAGAVITQTPLPGNQVLAGSGIQYLISAGPGIAPVSVPDVVGDTRKQAAAALKAKGLKADVRLVPSANIARGAVISQMPPAGSKAQSGSVVGLLVSKGNLADVAVPDLNAKSSEDASKTIATAGFRPVLIEITMPDLTPGQVFMQFPAAKTVWPQRYPLVCLVAKAP